MKIAGCMLNELRGGFLRNGE
jgi:hypothetical protein